MSISSALKALLAYKFEVVSGPHAGQSFIFDKASVSIGRGSDNHVVLPDDAKISRQHMEVKYANGEFRIQNMSQKNFTLLNGRKVDNHVLNYGDKIQIGETVMVFQLSNDKNAPSSAPVFSEPQKPEESGDNNKTIVVPKSPLKPVSSPVSLAPRKPQPQQPVARAAMPPPPYMAPPPTASYSPPPSMGGDGKSRFYIILGVVGVVVYFAFFSGAKKKKDEIRFDSAPTIQQELMNAENLKKSFEDKKSKMETIQAQRAEENFTKGFRDFMQGQYARAREHFQVVLTLDPEHQEARRYLTLSKLKFDEQVKKHLQQGRIYFENKNYRLCRASFSTAMTMLDHTKSDPSYVDAKKFYEACDLALGGR